MAIDAVAKRREERSGLHPLVLAAVAALILGGAVWFLLPKSGPPADAPLTAEAKGYLASLPLEDIEMTSAESFGGGRLIEIKGKITNGGTRAIKRAEVFCVFRDGAGQICLRQRWPIVATGLKPGESKPFRLPFDTVPDSWNQQLPNVVVASIQFE